MILKSPLAFRIDMGFLIFSNYSITRLQQCLKNLHPEHEVSVRGSSDFKNLFKMLSQHKSNEIQDTNKSRTLPALSELSLEQLQIVLQATLSTF